MTGIACCSISHAQGEPGNAQYEGAQYYGSENNNNFREDKKMKHRTTIIVLLYALTCQVSASTILWDASHGENGYVPSLWFSALSNHLAGYGFEIYTTYQGFLVDDPGSYDIAVVCGGSSLYSVYTTDEVEKIKEFVVNGGGLLIMGEMDNRYNEGIQPVASAFGVTLGVSEIGSYPYAIYTSDFAPHPLFDGIEEICFQSVGELSTSSNLEEVAWYEGTDKALIVAGDYGLGRVVALGDINIYSSFNGTGRYYYRADNRRFSVNTFEYFVTEPAIEAGVKIDPDTLNLSSKGEWITCYIWLPDEYNVTDVNSASVVLEDKIEAAWIWFDEQTQVVMVKFSRSDVQEMFVESGELGEVELTVRGELIDGNPFEGMDIIRVIDKGKN